MAINDGVSSEHLPGDIWQQGAGQGCAPGYVEAQVNVDGAFRGWTCIPQHDFEKVQRGELTNDQAVAIALENRPKVEIDPSRVIPTAADATDDATHDHVADAAVLTVTPAVIASVKDAASRVPSHYPSATFWRQFVELLVNAGEGALVSLVEKRGE